MLSVALLAAAAAGACSSSGGGHRAGATTTTAPPPVPATLGSYLPLYPFTSAAQVEQWQASFSASGNQAWHLDAGLTSTEFSAWLGYTGIDTVMSERTDASGAHVTVGVRPAGPSAASVAAAVIHLVHWGGGRHAPWEVVGTEDTTLTVDAPAYGSTVGSPLTVTGRVTGPARSLGVDVRASSGEPVGSYCCLTAGGAGTPWKVTVPLTASSVSTGEVLAVVARTGAFGRVDGFAVTGVRRS